MKLLEKMRKKKLELQQQLQNAREESEQRRAEKLRKKKEKLKYMKPGAIRAIREGLATRDTVMGVMRKEWERRKSEQKQK